jgi:hypothetical protein
MDSNHHGLLAHKALNLYVRVSDASGPVFTGRDVRAKGRKGRI